MEINRILKSAMADEDARKFVEKENSLFKRQNEISTQIHASEIHLIEMKKKMEIVVQQRDRALQKIGDSAQNKHVFKLSKGLSKIMENVLKNKSESIKRNLEKLIVENLQCIYRKDNLITHIEVEDDFQFNLYQNVKYSNIELIHLIKNLGKEKTAKKEENTQQAAVFQDLEEKMKAALGTKVSINRKNDQKGKIEIEYYSMDELERLMEILMK